MAWSQLFRRPGRRSLSRTDAGLCSRSQLALVPPINAASLPPVEHKLVRTNRGNGLKYYCLGSHARSIVGWTGIASSDCVVLRCPT